MRIINVVFFFFFSFCCVFFYRRKFIQIGVRTNWCSFTDSSVKCCEFLTVFARAPNTSISFYKLLIRAHFHEIVSFGEIMILEAHKNWSRKKITETLFGELMKRTQGRIEQKKSQSTKNWKRKREKVLKAEEDFCWKLKLQAENEKYPNNYFVIGFRWIEHRMAHVFEKCRTQRKFKIEFS